MRRLSLCKLCEIEDFADAELIEVIRDAYPPPADQPSFPAGRESRKLWEVAQAIRALSAGGAVRPDAEILGVGAGAEQTTFWLTRYVRRVFATDLYLTPGDWGEQAAPAMLIEPERHAAGSWNRRRLVVQHMDALNLRYEDESFDGVYSCGSIEHFGTLDDVRRAAHEMCRVLKPGGIAALSTEYRIAGDEPPGMVVFDARALTEAIVNTAAWILLEPLDVRLSAATRASPVDFALAVEEQDSGSEWSQWPHLVLEQNGLTWTSVSLALRKRG